MAGPGEALVRIRSTGPNARDYSIMGGGMIAGRQPVDRIPLCDMAGEVVAVGDGVSSVAVGDRVTIAHYRLWIDGRWDISMSSEDHGQTLDGFLRELAVLPAHLLLKIPDALDFAEAGTLPSAGLTAWNAVVETGKVQPGETVVTIGTGGVSVFAMQWAKLRGARVIVTSSSDEKMERMKSLGADEGINYRTNPNWHEAVMDLTGGRGADMVVNNVGMAEMDGCALSCTSGGRIMLIGAAPVNAEREQETVKAPQRFGQLIMRDLTLRGIVVGSRRMFATMMEAMAEHGVRPVIDRTFAFDEANAALAYAARGDKIGKVAITI
ncbi:MAG: NAD(P)-dependent alcohol dehydrogenase [Sphingobium sp.]